MIKLRQYQQDLLRQVQGFSGQCQSVGDDAVTCQRWQDYYREGTAGCLTGGQPLSESGFTG